MVSRIKTVAFQGIDVLDIDVQVQILGGMPQFTLVGLPDKAVGESRERVRSALYALGLALPPKRITVNLAPADVLKEGSHFDLPIALALLAAMEVLPAEELSRYMALGELALDGALTPVAGVLPAAVSASAHGRGLICPAASGGEAAWAADVEIIAPPTLLALINHFKGSQVLRPPEPRLAAAASAASPAAAEAAEPAAAAAEPAAAEAAPGEEDDEGDDDAEGAAAAAADDDEGGTEAPSAPAALEAALDPVVFAQSNASPSPRRHSSSSSSESFSPLAQKRPARRSIIEPPFPREVPSRESPGSRGRGAI